MPDDHSTTAVVYETDSDYEFMQITDLSDINYGKDFDVDMETVLHPNKHEFTDSEFANLFGHD